MDTDKDPPRNTLKTLKKLEKQKKQKKNIDEQDEQDEKDHGSRQRTRLLSRSNPGVEYWRDWPGVGVLTPLGVKCL